MSEVCKSPSCSRTSLHIPLHSGWCLNSIAESCSLLDNVTDLVKCVWLKIASEHTFTLTTAIVGGNDDVPTGILGKEVIYKDVRCETRPNSGLETR
jgi:hypothetical protein